VSSLLVRGGCDAHGRRLDVTIIDGKIAEPGVAVVPGRILEARGLTVLPGLIDLQVNGAAGLDITAQPDSLWDVAAVLPTYGVTAFAPTVISADRATREAALAALRQGPPAGWAGAVPLGLHFEGPMLAPTRRGAHSRHLLAVPTLELVAGWSREAGVLMATVAPELPGAIEVVEGLADRGVVVCIGHTDASTDQAAAAVAAGAAAVTHLGNAMPPLLAREPGPVGLALAGPDLVGGVIADGHHLHPSTLQAFWRALGPERFLAVSDTTAALGIARVHARLGGQDVLVADGAVRLADGTLAGSAASLSQCLAVLLATTRCSVADAVSTATSTPARLIGDKSRGSLAPGRRGDVTLVDTSAAFDVVETIVGGEVMRGTVG
jgi:N-acetylglucosamine-6-phosphate deacetylase